MASTNKAGGPITPNSEALSLRLATPADAVALARIGRETFIETFGHLYSDEDLHAYLAGAYDAAQHARDISDNALRFWIIEYEGAIAGYAKAGPCKLPVNMESERAFEIYRLYVRGAYQGGSVGRMLIEAVLTWMRGQGADTAYLGVWEHNLRAQRFYARYGFAVVGEYGFPVGKQVDRELIMRAAL